MSGRTSCVFTITCVLAIVRSGVVSLAVLVPTLVGMVGSVIRVSAWCIIVLCKRLPFAVLFA